ncbi:MAG: FAD binding domain-containing protein [Paracoccaceae bacterium]
MPAPQSARPHNLAGLAKLVAQTRSKVTYIAGGTDLVMALGKGELPEVIVDISQLAELNFVDTGDQALRLGAATTMAALARLPDIDPALAALSQAARQFGSVQIRNRATIGGNIASAMPAGDLLAVLQCLDCRIEVLRDGQITTHELQDIVTGAGQTSLGNGDLIVAISFPRPSRANRRSAFAKLGPRQEMTIACLCLAISAHYFPDTNRIGDVRLVAGAVGPVPVRLFSVEQALNGRSVDQNLADDFLHALSAAVDAEIAERASRPYKRRAIMGLGLDLLAALFGTEFKLALPFGGIA